MIYLIGLVIFALLLVSFIRRSNKRARPSIQSRVIDRSGMKTTVYRGDLFTHSKKEAKPLSIEEPRDISPVELVSDLAEAAKLKLEAKEAIKEQRFDHSWQCFMKMKAHYAQHAINAQFSHRDFISLDASVHELMANQLRLERRNEQAFIDILYWVISQRHRPIKRHTQKLNAYFNRCRFSYFKVTEVESFISRLDTDAIVDIETIEKHFKEWKTTEQLLSKEPKS